MQVERERVKTRNSQSKLGYIAYIARITYWNEAEMKSIRVSIFKY